MKYFNFFAVAILLVSSCSKNEAQNLPQVPATRLFIKGADCSWITQQEAEGIKFYNSNGVETEGMALLKSQGINLIRLRVWVNPTGNYNTMQDVLLKAKRATALGLQLLIDFHYSHTWADPSQQAIPTSWAGQNLEQLKTSVYNHTTAQLQLLKDNNISPTYVQIGNETNNGMLWPIGQATTSMSAFTQLFNSGCEAAKSIFPNTKVMFHVSNGYNAALSQWLLDGITNNQAKFDCVGLSLYPSPTNWQTYTSQCITNINNIIARYNKPVMIAEIGMPHDSPNECKQFIQSLIAQSIAIPNNNALGVVYWEPQCYNNWQGYSLGAFSTNGRPTVALQGFQ